MCKTLANLAVCTLLAATSAHAIVVASVGRSAPVSVSRPAYVAPRTTYVAPPKPVATPAYVAPAAMRATPSAGNTYYPPPGAHLLTMPHVNPQCSDERKKANKAAGRKECQQ